MTVRQQNAQYVLRKYYTEAVMDLVHPGNLGTLPPSPQQLGWKARQMGLMDEAHVWALSA